MASEPTTSEAPVQILNIPRGTLQAMVRQVITNELGGTRQALKAEIDRMVEAAVQEHLPKAVADVQKRADQLILDHINRQLGGWASNQIEAKIKQEVERKATALLKERLEKLRITLDAAVADA